MSLGGGTWTAQNKALPGAYINFNSAPLASSVLSGRGVVTLPLTLKWGASGVREISCDDFRKDSLKLFGYAYDADEMKPLREVFLHARTGYFYRLNTAGDKAACDFGEAKYPGSRGNDLKIVITAGEGSTVQNPIYDVATLLGTAVVDQQKGITAASQLADNDFVVFDESAELELTAGVNFTSGTDGSVTSEAYQAYLDAMEAYSFNVMGCPSKESTVKALFAAYTKRMRDDRGVKFQTVLHRYETADYEGVISVENGLESDATACELVYWVTGAQAGCQVNQSLTNRSYDGEYAVKTDYTQVQLEAAVSAGKFIFHRVNREIRVLSDINTLHTFPMEKSSDFSKNQVIRVMDQIGNDIAYLFNTKYLGRIPNDNGGRISLWNDVVKQPQTLMAAGAIENFSGADVIVEAGAARDSVVIMDSITPVSAMEKLYMQVIVA